MNEITERWENTGLLRGINEDFKDALASCLEQQIEFNRSSIDIPKNPSSQFKTNSIPIIRRTFPQVFKNNIIGLPHEGSYNFYLFKSKFVEHDQDHKFNLDEEAELIAKLSNNLVEELKQLFNDKTKQFIKFHGLFGTTSGDIIMYYS